MDPAVLWAVAVVIGVPVVVLACLAVLTATADFVFQGLRVRGGDVRGAVVGALAQVVVGEADTLRLPLLLTLRKKGLFGSATPLLGGAVVEGIEWKVRVEGEHVSTMTESHPVHIGALTRVVDLPVDASVHPPRGLVRTYAQYRRSRRAGAEVRIEVDGVVRVRVFGVRRAVPVRVGQYLVLGEARPKLEALEWRGHGQGRAHLVVSVRNPYRGQALEGVVAVDIWERRRLRRDRVIGRWVRPLILGPATTHQQSLDVTLTRSTPPDGNGADPVRLRARALWGQERLRLSEDEPPQEEDEADADDDSPDISLVPSVILTDADEAPELHAEVVETPSDPA